MRARKLLFILITGLVVAAATFLGWQRRTTDRLRSEILRHHRAVDEERLRLEDEQRRLMAAQAPVGELQSLRAERMAVVSLQKEIESMRHRADDAARVSAARNSPAPAGNGVEHSMTEGAVPARLWRKAGQATPEATFETALWAGAGGNVESLAGLLVFDEAARTKAVEIFAELPAAVQQELATPERLIALLVAKDIPLGSAEILTQATPADALKDTKLAAKLVDSDGKSKEVHLSLRARDGSWRFVVPTGAVEKYAAQLRAPVVAP